MPLSGPTMVASDSAPVTAPTVIGSCGLQLGSAPIRITARPGTSPSNETLPKILPGPSGFAVAAAGAGVLLPPPPHAIGSKPAISAITLNNCVRFGISRHDIQAA